MKLVPENLNEVNFERGRDPRDAMNIGDQNARDFAHKQSAVKQNYQDLGSFVDHQDPENMDLRLMNDKINSLIDSAEKTIIDYFNKKYNLGLSPVYHRWRSTENLFAESDKNKNRWEFYSNSSGAGVFIHFSDGRDTETSRQSYKMKTIEKKFLAIVKEFNVQL
jgi:hypothetical protein